MTTMHDDLQAAQRGDRAAFERLFAEHIPTLRGVLRRMVGHPDDVDELAQQAQLQAFESIAAFRGDARPATWLCAIGTRLAIDHLRRRERWRERAQVIYAASCLESEALAADIGAAFGDEAYRYDVREHIAYCFTCVGRTLEPEAQAALVLRDVLELSNDEAAKALDLSRSVFRHQLAAARETMQRVYDGLCALVSKRGICWQCAGLRDASPPERRGPPAPATLTWPERLRTVREANLDRGTARALHDVFFRHTEVQEREGRVASRETTLCGHPSDE